jgi:cell division septum initiation protein DivIVA
MAIDILSLVDRLEALMREAKHVPLSSKLAMDEQALANLVDQMRLSIPEQVQEAEALLKERDAVLARAQDEAQRMLAEAKVRIDEERMLREAEQEAEAILQEARDRAAAFEDDARLYVRETLEHLAEQLQSIQTVINNGLQQLAPAAEEADVEEPPASS